MTWQTGDILGPTNLNATIPSWFSSTLSSRLGLVFADDFGALGDGATDDTAALQSAESAKLAGYTLKFTPGKTYIVGKSYAGLPTSAASFLRFTTPGYWDLSGATLKYGSTTALATGSDGGGLGVVSILTSGANISGGVLDCGLHARYGLVFQSQINGFHMPSLTISNSTDEANNTWAAMAYAASVDVTGVAISGRAKNISGTLIRPNCPTVDPNTAVISGHQNVTALILGGEFNNGNASGYALVVNDNLNINTQLISHGTDTTGILRFPGDYKANNALSDFVTHDLGCNQIEVYGVDASTNSQFHAPSGETLSYAAHKGVGSGWYFDNAGTDANGPNVWISGGGALNHGIANFSKAHTSLRTTTSSGNSSSVSDSDIAIVALSNTSAQLAVRSGNTTYLFNAIGTAL